MSTARLPDEPLRMIEAGEVSGQIASRADLSGSTAEWQMPVADAVTGELEADGDMRLLTAVARLNRDLDRRPDRAGSAT